jgi:hypothetical protein
VGGGRIVLDGGRVGTFPIASAQLGVWRVPRIGMTGGSVLHLSDGARVFRLCGLDHRAPPSALRVAPTETTDATMPAGAFEALLELVLGPRPAFATSSRRVALFPNPGSAKSALKTMAPWLITMAATSVVGSAVGTLAFTIEAPWAEYLPVPLIVLMIIGGLIVTIRMSMRTKEPELTLEIDRSFLRLRDPKTDAVTFETDLRSITVARSRHRTGSRVTLEYPVLSLLLEGRPLVAIGVYDGRYSWTDKTPWMFFAPRYVVGTPDWNELSETFGLSRIVSVHGL